MERMSGTGWHLFNGVVGVPVVWAMARWLIGPVRARLHRVPPAVGDAALAAVIEVTAVRGTGRLAVVTVDLGDAGTPVREAFIGADSDTTFEIGSVTKGLTGFLVADAVTRGELSLDTHLESLLPQLADTVAGGVTVREACTHTSGLPRLAPSVRITLGTMSFALFGADPYRGTTREKMLRSARRVGCKPGSQYAYSNLGAAVAGAAVAATADTHYAELVRRRIVQPLGMTRTSAAGDLPVRRGRGRGWMVANWRLDGYGPAGAVVSTAADLTRLVEAMLDRTVPGAAAMDPVLVPDGKAAHRRQGLFWINDAVPGTDRTAVWHNGETGGYSSYLAVYPQAQRAVIVLSSVADSAGTERIAVAAVNRMIEGF